MRQRELTKAAAEMGRRGGLASGPQKVRGDADHYRALQARGADTRRINAHLRREWPSIRRLRHRADGGVEAYGKRPNAENAGWWFAGWRKDLLAQAARAARARKTA